MHEPAAIDIVNARVHNLKGVTCSIPRGKLSVVTGPSGSGKSSLVFDTIWVEAQRRYTESLPSYVRQILGVWEKPPVDRIEGLSPAIALDARPAALNPRSTVGTASEIYDYLRLLYARAGVPDCPSCGAAVESTPREKIIGRLLALPEGTRLTVTAPLGRVAAALPRIWSELRREGFLRVLLGGELRSLDEEPPEVEDAELAVVIDRLTMRSDVRQRLAEAVETALARADGTAGAIIQDGEPVVFSEKFRCARCGFTFPELAPASFSFNSPHGACDACKGTGVVAASEELADRAPARTAGSRGRPSQLPQATCPACRGARLKREFLSVKFAGKAIDELAALPLDEARAFFRGAPVSGEFGPIVEPICAEIGRRLDLLLELGLSYVSLARPVPTLSAGEHQRLRLATQIGANLAGILYVLDEPTVGLHPAETEKLIRVLRSLCDQGNTVIIVEHDLAVIRAADHVIDLGPGAGPFGGEIVAAGTPAEIAADERSITGRYLAGTEERETGPESGAEPGGPPKRRTRPRPEGWIELSGASANNLKGIDARFPMRSLCCVTGPSGSGKSTLVVDTLYRALARKLNRSGDQPGAHRDLRWGDEIRRVVAVDQSPIGRTARSNPATYTGLFGPIRSFFAKLPLSRVRGYGPSRFSFNAKGGRCEACQGDGAKRVSMQFLPDIVVPCEMCGGKRFNEETLDVRYRGLSIADVLALTVAEAKEPFEALADVARQLRFLEEIGLGYLELGQAADTLSGGEAQRLKLSRELARQSRDAVYILDEPTTGLHAADIRLLLAALRGLVAAGNTVIVIEHNVEFIAQADHVIDLGPGGGAAGGEIVARGTPEEIARNPRSVTGRYLR